MGLNKHIDFPTHSSVNALDLIIMEILSLVKVVKCILGPFILDHAVIECYLLTKMEDMLMKIISIRNLKGIEV